MTRTPPTFEEFTAQVEAQVPALKEARDAAQQARRFAGDVARNLHWLRVSRGLTAKQVGHSMGVNQPFVSKLENGKAELTLYWLARYCEAVDVTPGWVVEMTWHGIHQAAPASRDAGDMAVRVQQLETDVQSAQSALERVSRDIQNIGTGNAKRPDKNYLEG